MKRSFMLWALVTLLTMPIYAQKKSTTSKTKSTQNTSTTVVSESKPQGTIVIYYDANWKGVQAKDFATYERKMFYSDDPHYPDRFIDYRMDGTIQAEGTFQSIDKYDDSNSKFIETKSYYPNGSLESQRKYENDKVDVTVYYHSGNIMAQYSEVNGKVEGILKKFNETGNAWIEMNYVNGELDPSQQYYYAKTIDGGCVKHDAKTNKKQDIETPTDADRFTELEDGRRWDGFKKNGLEIAVCADKVEDYGGKNNMLTTGLKLMVGNKGTKQYTRVLVVINNNTATPVVFDPSTIVFSDVSKPNKPKNLEFVSLADYTKSLEGSQKWQANYNAADEQAQAKDVATTSRSSSNTSAMSNSSSSSNSHSSLDGKSSSAVAGVGVSGALVGGSSSYVNGRSDSASSSSSASAYDHNSASETVDANVYRQNMKDAEQNIAEFNQSLEAERQQKLNGYLKATTIEPLGTYAGFILTRNTSVTDITCDIILEGIKYPVVLKVSDIRNN